jgi:hypothetical protein
MSKLVINDLQPGDILVNNNLVLTVVAVLTLVEPHHPNFPRQLFWLDSEGLREADYNGKESISSEFRLIRQKDC